MLNDIKSSIGIAASSELPNLGIMLTIMFIAVALLLGIPAILKKSLKGVLLAVFLSVFATAGTYILFM